MAKRVVIIGGVAAGPKIAAKLRRLDHEVDIAFIAF
jgi:NADH dehydrogenase FAD-containing subunit